MRTKIKTRQIEDWRKTLSTASAAYKPLVNRLVLMAVDLLALLLSAWAAHGAMTFHQVQMLGNATAGDMPAYGTPLYWTLAIAALAFFTYHKHYDHRAPALDETVSVIKVALCGALLHAALMFFAQDHTSRLSVLTAWICAAALIPTGRAVARRHLANIGTWSRPTIIIGTGANARDIASALSAQRGLGLQVCAFLGAPGEIPTHDTLTINGQAHPAFSYGTLSELAPEELENVQLIFALEHGGLRRQQTLIAQLSRHHKELAVVPDIRGLPLHGMTVSHFHEHEFLMLRVANVLAEPIPRTIKRLMDILASALLLVLLSPFFLYVILQIRRDGGPAMFAHQRVGVGGRAFPCYKFRTMVANADVVLRQLLEDDPRARAEWEQSFKLRNDPRVTRIGKFLRRTSLDELPQLWNVLRGDMSLVGPRPVIAIELERYGDQKGLYLATRPGMTGLWQISGRSDTSYEYRVALDSRYVKNWSVWSDMLILFRTASVVLRGQGAY